MASIITATTSSGLVSSADNSGVLQLASGTGNLVTVPSVTGTAMVSGNMPTFSAYASSNQTVSANTYTKVTLDTEVWDTNSNFASSRFTPTVAGYYQINANVSSSTTGDNFCLIYKNGTVYRWGNYVASNAGAMQHISCLVDMNGTTDYIELYAYTGGTQFNGSSSNIQTYMDGYLARTL
jgi:hypothetical protein